MARKDEIAGLAAASDERIEAYLLYGNLEDRAAEILAIRSFIEDRGARLKGLLLQLRARGVETLRFPKVHPAEIAGDSLETLGFRPAARHVLYATSPRPA
jgi:hypothetical protein